MKRFSAVYSILILLAIIFGLNFNSVNNDIYFEIGKNIDLFGKIYKEVTLNYVDEISPTNFMKNGINGMLESLDPYSSYIDNSKRNDIDLLTTGKYGGIGVMIGVKNNELTITEVVPNYSAHRQGIRVGDVILEIDGNKVTQETIDERSISVRGEPGTEVILKIKREGEPNPLVFHLIREEIQVNNLSYADFLPGEPNVAYFKLDRFSRRAGEELKQAVKRLKEKGEIKYCIIDIRNNPGGLLESSVEILEKFVQPNEKLVETRGRTEESVKAFYSKENPIFENIPLAILINENSASASEILAGAIQDLDRGIITGTQSFGKGLVQTVIPMEYNTILKLTTAKYYTPSGRCIQKLDYLHNSKGAFVVKPDSLKKTFYTKNNRPVSESGGIMPDTTIQMNPYSNITNELLKKGMFFKFATYYSNKNPNEDFTSKSEQFILDKFIQYLKETGFTFEDGIKNKFSEIESLIEKNKQYSKYLNEVKALKDKIKINLDAEINSNKNEIYWLIISELQTRKLGEEGRTRSMINIDNQLKETVKILKNKELYNKLLGYK